MDEAHGAYKGRRKARSLEQEGELRRRAGAGEQKTAVAREVGISRETFYQYLGTAS
ncbi:helix-turn-helix domain-containing protein [Arthrobacter sp. 2MCAF14]|uniref:helix-turn-helix domain-containing protein n=1 Tax=Arthrobacter sp. 2MCAF14 TaxID=3232982 RepID=UPI003F90B79E